MNILTIETSCDDTCVAVVSGKLLSENHAEFEIIANAANSQIEIQRQYGGVYPNVARREHAIHIPELLRITFNESDLDGEESIPEFSIEKLELAHLWLEREPELAESIIQFAWSYRSIVHDKIDSIAVTTGPGLAPALWIGINVARTLAYLWDIPLIATNHMAGHALSGLWPNHNLQIPALALLVSGGHTEIVKVNLPTSFEIVGKTIDDACGEAFDKVARILNLPYPGGPEISKLAKKHRADLPNYQSKYDLPFPMQHSGDFNFSFSGLKTAAKYLIEKNNLDDPQFVASFAREFEETVVKILVTKFEKAITEYRPQQLLVGGGVSSNQYLRSELVRLSKSTNIDLLISPTELCGDNAIMIAMSGFWQSIANNFTDPIDITAQSGWKISE